jgi:hypothetical protein
MKPRDVSARSLKRKVATRRPRKTLLIFCEGTRTEPDYLNALKRQPSVRDIAAIDLRVETKQGRTDPRSLVSLAVAARRRAIEGDDEIDEFWCVFDIEWPRNQPGLHEAMNKARQNGVEVAVSNPCFELWLILHFQDQSAWLDTEHACRLRRRLDASDGKGLSAAIYMPRAEVARQRAVALDERHRQDTTPFPHNNPSSGMHRLLATIQPAQAGTRPSEQEQRARTVLAEQFGMEVTEAGLESSARLRAEIAGRHPAARSPGLSGA